jgi:hypothetical protein
VQDADRVSDLIVCLPRNGLDDSVIQIPAEGAQAAVSFHILSSGGKGRSHKPSILAEEVQASQGRTFLVLVSNPITSTV